MTVPGVETIGTAASLALTAFSAVGVSKSFGAVRALQDMSLSLRAGEIHALVGENGSGKSTFVGIVSGTVVPDTGKISVADTELIRHRPADSQRAGVLTVFQDGSLIPELSVASNLFVGTPAALRPRYSEMDRWAVRHLVEHGLDFEPDMKVSELPPGDRQLLEIVRAVIANPRLLILDEATSALDPSGVDRVMRLIHLAAASGSAVLFVTHRLSEVFRAAEKVSVLRDGRFVGTYEASEATPHSLVELMAGTKVDMEFPSRKPIHQGAPVLLTASELRGPKFGPVNVELRAGEIVGIAGADGNGQGQLLRGLGMLNVTGGKVTNDSGQVSGYRQAVGEGILIVSRDRKNESLFQSLSISDNLSIGVLRRLSTAGFIGRRKESDFVDEQIDDFGIRLGSPKQSPAELSGGNQQKIALSRVLAAGPRVILVDEPTQGVDVRSRMDIYRMLRAAADSGSVVVFVSSDASELAGLADRVLVMSRGVITEQLDGTTSSEEQIVSAFTVESHVDDATTATDTASGMADQPRGRPRRKLSPELLRLVGLASFILLIGLFALSQNHNFASVPSLYNVFLLAVPLAAVAIAQYLVLLVGGIDVSVGATMSLSVVVLSFILQSSGLVGSLLMGLGASIVIGLVIGAINAWLIEQMKLSSVIATIAMLGVVSGIALALRPTPHGLIDPEFTTLLTARFLMIPWAFLALVILVIAGDMILRRTGTGLRLRAVGLNGAYAYRLGIRTGQVRAGSYILCAILAAVAGMLLAAQVGIGDASVGSSYTLLAIAAPVLGGASLSGGRGMLIGALLGSILLALSQTLSVTLGISSSMNLILIGVLTLIALMTYAGGTFRRSRTH